MPSAIQTTHTLSLPAAKIASEAAQKKAQEMGLDMNIALTSSSTHLLHFTRMPTAKTTSIQTAIDKAFTASGHRAPTSTYTNSPAAKNFQPGGPAYGIHNTNGGRFCIVGGGVPIFLEVPGEGRVCVGAIGVSAGTPAQDEEVAVAGVRAVEAWVKGERAKL